MPGRGAARGGDTGEELFALAPGRGLLAHREGGGTPHVYAQLRKPRDWPAEAVAADDDMYAAMVDDDAPHSMLALMTGA